MIKYTTLLHEKRKELEISMLEYVLMDTIEKLSKPRFRAHRKTLAEFIGMSRQGLIKAINRFIDKGLLIRVNDKEISVTQRWIDETISSVNKVDTSVNKVDTSVNKVYSSCKQSLQPTKNKNLQLELIQEPIKDFVEKAEEPSKSEVDIFDFFRKAYQGTKLGNGTEFKNFIKKHKDWREVLPDLKALLDCQINQKQVAKAAGQFVPLWKNLSTWINQRCWEEEPGNESAPADDIQMAKGFL